MFTRQLAQSVRRFTTTPVNRSGHHDPYDGLPGNNLPFNINNRFALTLKMAIFAASAVAIPFLNVRHQLLKKS